MSKFTLQAEITRRTALAALGSSAMGLAAMSIAGYGASDSRSDSLARLLPHWSEQSRAILRRLLENPEYSGRIPASDAAALARQENVSVDKLMLDLIPLAQSYSRAPISNFHVGVVVRGAGGDLYTGANIEIPGQCLGFAVHAEQSALSNAYMHSERGVIALAVSAAPCGHCRQFIEEMSPQGEMLILTLDQPPRKLSAILPEAFSPAALGMKEGAFPVRETKLSLRNPSSDALSAAALEAARKAYAPYSKSPAGVAIRGAHGRIYHGSYIENVAFNPSLSPLQTALAALIAGGEEYSAISACTLVELENGTISQAPVTETVLKAIAPAVKLVVVPARA
jgi:cytidine deaminase